MQSHAHVSRRFRRLITAAVAASLCVGLLPAAAGAAVPTSAPVVITPLDGTVVSANPVLEWEHVPGARKYRVQVSTTSTFDAPLLWQTQQDTFNTAATIPLDLPQGPIYWRVAATDGTSTLGTTGLGPYTTSTFTRTWSDAPELVAPADDAILNYPNETVRLRWNPLPGAKTYEVQVDDDPDFFNAPAPVPTSNTAFTLTEPQAVGQPYYWRVKAKAVTTGLETNWSMPRTYQTQWDAEPVRVAPANQIADPIQDVVLDWDPVYGAAKYQVQVDNDFDFSSPVIDQITKGTRYSPSVTLNNASYYWRVRAIDARSGQNAPPNEGSWSSPPWQFRRAWPTAPNLVAPADGDNTVTVPTFKWDPVKHASHYVINVGTDESFSPGTFRQCVTNQTSYTPYAILPGGATGVPQGTCDILGFIHTGETYHWRVLALDGPRTSPQPIESSWSATRSFSHSTGLATPLQPADGATVETPTLEWQPVPGEGKYRVRVYKASGGTAVSDHETFSTSFTPPEKLNPSDSPFRWVVTTVNDVTGEGGVPNFATWRQFTLVAPAAPVAAPPTVLTPANNTSWSRMPSMTWTPVAGADHYKVFYRLTSNPTNEFQFLPAEKLYSAGFTHRGTDAAPMLSSGQYDWRVQAYGANQFPLGDPSEWRAFTMLSPGVATGYVAPQECTSGSECAVPATPQLIWDAVPEASSYYVTIAADEGFSTRIGEYWTTFTSLTPRESLPDSQAGRAYYWMVRPCFDPQYPAARCGPADSTAFANAAAFRKQSPAVVLTSPTDGTSEPGEITFEWEDYYETNQDEGAPQEARQYRIEVSPEPDFSPMLETQTATITVDQPTYTPYWITYPDGPIHWRVQAIDNSGNFLTQSDAGSFTKVSNPVAPISPEAGTEVKGLPTLRWEPRLFTAQYDVQLFKNGDLGYSDSNRVVNQRTKLTAFAPTNPLPSGSYTWRVRSVDADGRTGPWANVGAFSLSPDPVNLLTPAVDELITSRRLLFTWTAESTAVRYRFQSSTSQSFTSPLEEMVTSAPAWAPTRDYTDQSYFWRVQVLNGSDSVIATSAARPFDKQTAMTTNLTLTRSASTVVDPDPVVLTGRLTRIDNGDALPNRTVTLWGRKKTTTTFSQLSTALTDGTGTVTFTRTPREHWDFQLRFPTAGVVVGDDSPIRTVLFRPDLRASLEKGGMLQGYSTRMSGTISPYYQGRSIFLEKRISGDWRTVATKTLGAPSRTPNVIKFAFTVSPQAKKMHYYRVRFPQKTNVNLGVITAPATLNIY